MRVNPQSLASLTIEEAQRVLDTYDPGYTIAVVGRARPVILDPDKNIVCQIIKDDVEYYIDYGKHRR